MSIEKSLRTKRGLILAFFAYLIQFPVLLGGMQGWFPIHPVIIFPPLLGLINAKIEKRGLEGLGLILPHPLRSLLLALILALPLSVSFVHIFALDRIAFSFPGIDIIVFFDLLKDFAIAVFIIAMWEEFVSRGYIQTRLQEVWGFIGVSLSAVMFATLHIPSAVFEFKYEPQMVLLNFFEMLVPGFMLSMIYWKTRSTLTTIAVHGFRNFIFAVAMEYSGLGARETHLIHPVVQILWRSCEVLVALLLLRLLFPDEGKSGAREQAA